MRSINYSTNPGAESAVTGWFSGGNVAGTTGRDNSFAAQMVGARGLWQFRWISTATAAINAEATVSGPGRAPVTPGQWVRVQARVWMDGGMTVRPALKLYNAAGAITAYPKGAAVHHPWYGGGTVTFDYQIPAGVTGAEGYLNMIASAAWTATGKRLWWDNVLLTVADTQADLVDYFDGDFTDGGGLTYGWDGTPGLSSSYRVDSVDLVHDWSRAWWKTLPGAYRAADVAQGYPLLRYMEGAGRVAGEVRALSDDMWGETFMNPATTPDTALRWVAQLMGVPAKIRDQPTADLRAYLVDLALNGRPASGTRGDLANAARRYLTGAKQVSVIPSPTSPHRIVLLVRADEVPGADVNLTNALNTLVANVRSTGVMPAGHELAAQAANPTWDSWEAAAGATWDTREAAARTWTEADSLGVVITA
ncbi:hydrolase [Arthrobacter phage Vibaki]|uniref:Hydrolase n=1 Tax=Arthrobacter phage Vibaki TaxID=2593333 RepID=A0A514TYY6_9CAUD|nr:tail protein [Arthrobacter phage Vibaki]QDK01912.1 hydrolase [Arthrobacter phage Vibaki]